MISRDWRCSWSSADQRKHQSSASLAFVQGIPRWPANSPHKGPATWQIFPFDDVIMVKCSWALRGVHSECQYITWARIRRLVVCASCRNRAIVEVRGRDVDYYWIVEHFFKLSLYVCETCIALGVSYLCVDSFQNTYTARSFLTNKFI